MRVKTIKDEDFVNFKKACMFIGTTKCTFKCCIEAKIPCTVCQNFPWSKNPIIDIDDDKLIQRYISNPLTEGIVFGGLEPMDQYDEVLKVIVKLREEYKCDDSVIIYTGYYKEELKEQVEELSKYKNIYFKFGRYKPGYQIHYDEVLGVNLVSDNQYGEKIS